MNIYYKLLTAILVIGNAFIFNSCVEDDDFSVPVASCSIDVQGNISISDLKAMYLGNTIRITEDLFVEGYVASSDRSGNIFETLYIQDRATNPTAGLIVGINVGNLYTLFPLGSKVIINLKDLYLGEFAGVVQLGSVVQDETGTFEFDKIPESQLATNFHRSCDDLVTVEPLTISSVNDLNDSHLGLLIKLDEMQLVGGLTCETYSPPNISSNRTIEDCSGNNIILRNSGFSDFAAELMPTGKGSITAIYSKFNTTDQLFIRETSDLDFTNPRCDGAMISCTPPADNADIQDIKDVYNGSLTQISDDLVVQATVTANDVSGNLFRLIYVEDETGGLRVRIHRTNLNFDPKYQVGRTITIAAKDLYIDDVNGELHLGGTFNGNIGNIEDDQVNQFLYRHDDPAVTVNPTVIGLTDVSEANLGKLVRFEDVEFADAELGNAFAPGSNTNRTFQDCNGNTLVVRTSSFANFSNQILPGGNGTLTGILSIFNGTYQLWLREINDVSFTNTTRCDGSVAPQTIFEETFEDLSNFTIIDVTGAQGWNISNFGNPDFSANMSGFSGGAMENEDWLVSNAIAIPSSASTATLSFETLKRFDGNDMEVFYTTNFTGDVATTSWTTLSPTLDTDTGSWTSWTPSGNLDISSTIGNNLYIAFKYTSTSSQAATWRVENLKVSITE